MGASTRADFESSLRQVAEELPALVEELSSAKEEDEDPLKRAEAHVAVAYTACSLFYMYLRLQGVDADAHPVLEELKRVEHAYAKVQKSKVVTEDGEKDGPHRATELDVPAAGRILASSLPDLSKSTRKKLKSASAKSKRNKSSKRGVRKKSATS